MIDDRIILAAERLRDELQEFKTLLRKRYSNADGIVAADAVKRSAARLAEKWMVEISPNREIAALIQQQYFADINVRFQRLLTFSEHSTKRARYDAELRQILNGFTADLIIPLKQARMGVEAVTTNGMFATTESRGRIILVESFSPTAFVAQSFSDDDKAVNECVGGVLEALGIKVVTGEKPKADRISEKIKQRINDQYLFVGIFTRRDKIARKPEWTTSAWVVDEKAYATGKGKKLVLLKESGVSSIGGIQGDYEYLEFSRQNIHELILKLLQMFRLKLDGLSD